MSYGIDTPDVPTPLVSAIPMRGQAEPGVPDAPSTPRGGRALVSRFFQAH